MNIKTECPKCNEYMYINWADEDGTSYKCPTCFTTKYIANAEKVNMNTFKILKVILEIQALTVGEACYEALKYSINNQCNIEFTFKTIKYYVVFNDIFLACKEMK